MKKEVRKIKVYEQSGRNYKPTPTIMLKGLWLEELGFGAGTLLPSEKAAVLAERYEKVSSQGRRNDILAEEYDVTIRSKNTGHIWYIHNPEYPGEGECIIFHKHRASQPYHQHGRARSLGQAVKSIKGHIDICRSFLM